MQRSEESALHLSPRPCFRRFFSSKKKKRQARRGPKMLEEGTQWCVRASLIRPFMRHGAAVEKKKKGGRGEL